MKAALKAKKNSKLNGKAKPADSSTDDSSSEEESTKNIAKMKKAVNKRKADDSSDEEPLPKPTPKKSKKKEESSSDDSSEEEPKAKVPAKSPKGTPAKAIAKKKKESSSESESSSSSEDEKPKAKVAAKSPAKATPSKVASKKKESSSEEESSDEEKAKPKATAKSTPKAAAKKESSDEESSSEEEKPKQKSAAKRKADSSGEESSSEEDAPTKKTKKSTKESEEKMDEDDSSDDVTKFKSNGVEAEPKKDLDYVFCFNVPEGTASTKLENFLSKRTGDIGSVQMIQGAVIGVEKGTAAEFAETLSGIEFSQQSLIAIVPPCQETAEKIATSSTCVATGASAGGFGNQSFGGGYDRSGGASTSKTLMVTGLPEDVNYGMIKKSIPGGIQYDIKGRDDRKCCFIQYESVEEAAETLQSCKGCNVGSSRVFIKFANERGGAGAGGRGGARGGSRGGGDFGGGNRRSFQSGDPSVAYSPCMALFNLPFSASEEEVKGHFDNVEKYMVPKSGMAILKFSSVEDCQTALSNVGEINLGGRQLRGEARDEAAADFTPGGFGGRGGGRGGGFRGGRGGRGGGGFGGRGGRGGGFRGGRGGGAAPAGKKTSFGSDSD